MAQKKTTNKPVKKTAKKTTAKKPVKAAVKKAAPQAEQKLIIGSEEWVALPEIGLPAINARVDSGARTSALHAFNIQPFEKDGKPWVRFDINPLQANRKIYKRCEAPLLGRREVKSSSGHIEKRHVIVTPIEMDGQRWEIEITLTNRDSMGYRMLLGRQAMTGRLIVDPERSYCIKEISPEKAERFYKKARTRKQGLNLILLASNADLYSNKRIIEAAEMRGHKIKFVNVKYCYINISPENASIHYRGGETLEADAVIPRLRPSMTFYGCAVVRQFENTGTYCLNDSLAITRSRDKLRSLQMLAQRGIPLPTTGFASSPEDTQDLVKMLGGAPLVIKLLEGTQGSGVVLAETNKAAESVINAFKTLKADILVQEFVKEAQGRDIRCFVIDGKVVGAMERKAAEGDFRANLHLGGTANIIKLTSDEKRLALRAAKILNLKVAGVDLIRSAHGPLVLEVNSSPGLEGIEDVTGKDIAQLMIEAIERHVS